MLQYHLMNIVRVKQPRWHDRMILPRLDKFKPGYNLITIDHPNYPSKYVIHTAQLSQYPTETVTSQRWGQYEVKAIPLNKLQTIQERQSDTILIMQTIQELGW